jgi:DNA/RNA endonuclease YhcR with UshA esterase domain
MKAWQVVVLLFAMAIAAARPLMAQKPSDAVPKYDVSSEAKFKGVIDEVKDRQCPISGGMGSHFMLKLPDGKIIEVHLATTKFVKNYELVFNKGDEVEVTGTKVEFEGADAILAREVKRGNDDFVFRDPHGKPVW